MTSENNDVEPASTVPEPQPPGNGPSPASGRQPFLTLVWRSLRRRCPSCGKGKLFRRWLLMHTRCPACSEAFEREAGFFLGSIYFNYGLTALIVAVAYPVALFGEWASQSTLLGVALAFCIFFPIFFFPFARSLWLGFDEFCDPRRRDR